MFKFKKEKEKNRLDFINNVDFTKDNSFHIIISFIRRRIKNYTYFLLHSKNVLLFAYLKKITVVLLSISIILQL